jgi:hypothetical protein
MLITLIIVLVVLALFCVYLMRLITKLVSDHESMLRTQEALLRKEREDALKREHPAAIAEPAADSVNQSQPVVLVSDQPSEEWIKHAYPLQQVLIKLQGTRHSERDSIVQQLTTILERLNAGDAAGQRHDDDFGYSFSFVKSSPGPSFFEAPASHICEKETSAWAWNDESSGGQDPVASK